MLKRIWKLLPEGFRVSVRPYLQPVIDSVEGSHRQKKLNYVHVGKCAGTSIGQALQKLGVDFAEHHCFDADRELSLLLQGDKDYFFLISVRDPIKRFISAFYWDLYEKRMLNDLRGPNGIWALVYERYKTPNELAEALSASDPGTSEFAKSVFTESHLHMHYSLGWYLSPADVSRLSVNNAFTVRTEHADEDFRAFIRRYLDKDVEVQLPREKSDYKHNIQGYSEVLSDLAIRNLKEMYRDDYLILKKFREMGLNSYDDA